MEKLSDIYIRTFHQHLQLRIETGCVLSSILLLIISFACVIVSLHSTDLLDLLLITNIVHVLRVYSSSSENANTSLLRGHWSALLPLDWPFLPSLVLQRTRRVRPEEVDACRCMLRWLRSAELVIDEEGPGQSQGQGPGLLDPLPLAVRFARLASLFLFGMRYYVSLVYLPTYTLQSDYCSIRVHSCTV